MYIEELSSNVRNGLCAYMDHLKATGERVLITRYGQGIAALVSVEDLKALEWVEQNREEFLEARHHAKMREFRALKEGLG